MNWLLRHRLRPRKPNPCGGCGHRHTHHLNCPVGWLKPDGTEWELEQRQRWIAVRQLQGRRYA